MISNGECPTSQDAIYTVPVARAGVPQSGSNITINLFRVVNNAAVTRTVSIYLNVNGTARLLSPKGVVLSLGAAYDDIPVIELPPGATIEIEASGADVHWTLNAFYP